MKITASGPSGALSALSSIEAEIHGVRVRSFWSGREVSNQNGYGETDIMVCYVDGKRVSRKAALERLSAHIPEGVPVTIEGPIKFTRTAKPAGE